LTREEIYEKMRQAKEDRATYDFIEKSDLPKPDELEYDFVEREGEAKNGAAEKREKEETTKKGTSKQLKKEGKRK